MDRLELAQRRFRQIVPKPVLALTDVLLRKAMVWLADDVCPVVEEYRKRPAFRERATWALRSLAQQADSAERRLIDAVDRGVVAEAELLLRLSQQNRVQASLVAANPRKKRVVKEAVLVGGGRIERVSAKVRSVNDLKIETVQIEQIADRFWIDLVCPDDYFEPLGGWMVRAPRKCRRQAGEFVVQLNPELHPIGDFVTRSLLRRVDVLLEILHVFRRKCLAAAENAGANRDQEIREEYEIWQDLDVNVHALRKACATGSDRNLRDSCIILTQAYAAFGCDPELAWLGLRPDTAEFGVVSLRHRLTGSRNPEMLDRIAAAIGDLRRLYVNDSIEQSHIEEAIATGGLVLLENGHQAFWETRRIEQPWHKQTQSWELLCRLASKALHQGAVVPRDLDSAGTSSSVLPTAVNRLKILLPPSLAQLIEVVRGERAYRLKVDRNQIHVL